MMSGRLLREPPPPLALKAALDKETLASLSAEMARAQAKAASDATAKTIAAEATGSATKKSLWERFKKEMIHYWHGTKLLGKEINISTKLANRLLHGSKLTRREQRQLRRTTGDLLRLIPFSVFIIVPFMEFLLPVALKLFPNMLPSTFEDSFAEEEKKLKLLKMRLEMAKFLQETIEESGIPGSERAQRAKEFGEFFRKIRTTGEQASTEELIRIAQLFSNQMTLENLTRPQLVCMTRYMNLNAFGTDTFLRYQIRTQMNSIKNDDKLIMAEGVESLTSYELQTACQSRGIPTHGTSPARLRSELSQWLELHVTRSIPSSLLILSRAFSFSDPANLNHPGSSPTQAEALQATLSSLPDILLTETKFHVSQLEGAATAEQKLEALKRQEELIANEKAQELKVEQARKARREEARIKKEVEDLEKAKSVFGELPSEGALGLPSSTEAVMVDGAPLSTIPSPPPSLEATQPTITLSRGSQDSVLDDKTKQPVTVVQVPKTDSPLEAVAKAATATIVPKSPSAASPHPSEGLVPAVTQSEVSVARSVEDDQDNARMTEEQLLEFREALSIMSSRSAVLEEREELEYLKENRKEYKEDIEELAQVQRQEHKVSRRLGARLEKMISRLDQEIKAFDEDVGNRLQVFQANERGELTVEDIETALKIIKHAPDEESIKRIVKKLDVDGDGWVLLSHIVELADLVEEEEGTGTLVVGKRVHGNRLEEVARLRKEDILKDVYI
ncbi:hypothetical protein BGZ83_007795 [Gryganskiella cystojenkinii]|nr:hypothetical protein BGZ83_007795 [Gryganskiella cystojenkinii]